MDVSSCVFVAIGYLLSISESLERLVCKETVLILLFLPYCYRTMTDDHESNIGPVEKTDSSHFEV